MLYETIGQGQIFLVYFLIGCALGLFYFLLKKIIKFNKNNIFKQFFLFFLIIFLFLLIFFINLYLNYGEFRFYILFSIFLGYFFVIYFIKTICKIIKKWYNDKKDNKYEDYKR